jgi:hypothetical protein
MLKGEDTERLEVPQMEFYVKKTGFSAKYRHQDYLKCVKFCWRIGVQNLLANVYISSQTADR